MLQFPISVAAHNVTIVDRLIGHKYSNVTADSSIELPCMFSRGALFFIDHKLVLMQIVTLLKEFTGSF